MDYVKENWKKVLSFTLLGIFVLGFISLAIYVYTPYSPKNFTLQQFQKDNLDLDIKETTDYFELKPDNLMDKKTALIFYPGGRVDSTAYLSNFAVITRRLEVTTYVLKVPFNFAILNINAAQKVLDQNRELEEVSVGGHSLGGVAAASFASENLSNSKIKGLFLFASYPSDSRLKDSNIKVLSIYGSRDGFVDDKTIEDSKKNLPTNTKFVKVEGMNHSQFGSYGLQQGDNSPEINNEQALEQVIEALKIFTDRLSS